MEIKQHEKSQLWITTEGQVKGIRTDWRKLAVNNSGYQFIHFRTKNYFIHRMVVETYVGEIPKGYVVNHLDGNKINNKLNNLEICTYSENAKHAIATGLKTIKQAEDSPLAKYSNEDYRHIIRLLIEGKTNTEISNTYNLHSRYVSLIRHKKRLKHIWLEFDEIAHKSTDNFKLELEQCKCIVKNLNNKSNLELSKEYNIDPSVISKVRHKKIWKMIWDLVTEEDNFF